MAKKKRYEFRDHSYNYDEEFERKAKKKSVRDAHKEHWKYDPCEDYGDQENETDDWEGYYSG